MSFKNITVAGSGVLGSQIAYQTAFHGFTVSVYDINDEAIEKAKERYQNGCSVIKKILMQRKKRRSKPMNALPFLQI